MALRKEGQMAAFKFFPLFFAERHGEQRPLFVKQETEIHYFRGKPMRCAIGHSQRPLACNTLEGYRHFLPPVEHKSCRPLSFP